MLPWKEEYRESGKGNTNPIQNLGLETTKVQKVNWKLRNELCRIKHEGIISIHNINIENDIRNMQNVKILQSKIFNAHSKHQIDKDNFLSFYRNINYLKYSLTYLRIIKLWCLKWLK